MGDISLESTWDQLDELLSRAFIGHDGAAHTISMLAVDSGFRTQMTYNWARRHPMSRVIATKGMAGSRALVGAASPVDVTVNGKKLRRGYKVWPVGVDVAKGELYGWLKLDRGEDGGAPAGYCHFPEHGEEFFKQLTAEYLATSTNKRTRRTKMEWHVLANRENHYLDCRILARVAAAVLGIDRLVRGAKPRRTKPAPPEQPTSPPDSGDARTGKSAAPPEEISPRDGFWKGARDPRAPRGGWLKRRR
jgi:phage terminase large subunit GpA-like protein